jgi:hypothetical protein
MPPAVAPAIVGIGSPVSTFAGGTPWFAACVRRNAALCSERSATTADANATTAATTGDAPRARSSSDAAHR